MLQLVFYLIMFVFYLFADGKIGKSEKNRAWLKKEGYGEKFKKNIKILVVIYTLWLIITMI